MSQTLPTALDKLGARQRIDAAVRAIEEARAQNKLMQRVYGGVEPRWHQHESIDDKLFDALTALGD